MKEYKLSVELLQEIEKVLLDIPARQSIKVLNALYKTIDEQNLASLQPPKKDE